MTAFIPILYHTIIDGIIVTRHVGSNQITSPKIAEAFVRGRKKAANTTSAPTGLTLQYGWDYVVGSGVSELVKAITFPVAYTEPPVVILVPMAAAPVANGTPADTNSFITHFSAIKGTQSDDITTSGFNARCFADASFSSTFNFGFSWIAIGKV